MFLTSLNVKYKVEDNRWVLSRALLYRTEGGWEVEVPKGYSTDLDSVPRIPFVYAWLKGQATKSAVVHDWLYDQKYNRRRADKILLEAMKDEGVPRSKRWAIYLGVRTFGWIAYI
jgi:hypothetical protein